MTTPAARHGSKLTSRHEAGGGFSITGGDHASSLSFDRAGAVAGRRRLHAVRGQVIKHAPTRLPSRRAHFGPRGTNQRENRSSSPPFCPECSGPAGF